MKLLDLTRSIVAVALVFSVTVDGASGPQNAGGQQQLSEEDSQFWDRYLHNQESSITLSPTKAPTDSPTKAPTDSPTKAPTDSPTKAPVGGPCDVEVSLTCVNSKGLQCNQLKAPPSACADGTRIRTLTFRYQNCLCPASFNLQPNPNDAGENICIDSAPLVEAPVVVECRGPRGLSMSVSPAEVLPDGLFTVTNPTGGFLPLKVYCDILDGVTGAKLQTNIIDTSGQTSLNLEDKYGAMLLESCDELTCVETISYTIDIENIGRNCLDMTQADFVFNDDITNLLPLLPSTELCPEKSTSFDLTTAIDVCTAGDYFAQAIVVANPPDKNAGFCEDDAELSFAILEQATNPPTFPPTNSPTFPPTKAPTYRPTKSPSFPPTKAPVRPPTQSPVSVCTIRLDTRCVVAGNSTQAGRPCETPFLGIESCKERPTSAVMLFNGGGCAQSDNTQGLLFSCVDMNGGPPVNEGERAYIEVTDIKGNQIDYFSGVVEVGNTYRINDNNERFEADMFITIYTPDQRTVLQSVQFHSSCSRNLELKNRFGASQLVEFTNDLQGTVSCFVTFSFTLTISVPISATTTQPIVLTRLTATTNFAGNLDLTTEVAGLTIAPGSAPLLVTLEGVIDASSQMRYTLMFYVEGAVAATGQKCTGSETLSFLAGHAPGARSPVASPTSEKSKKRK
jgi:hypothetical protein